MCLQLDWILFWLKILICHSSLVLLAFFDILTLHFTVGWINLVIIIAISICVDFTVSQHRRSDTTTRSFLPNNASNCYAIFSIVCITNSPAIGCIVSSSFSSTHSSTRFSVGNAGFGCWAVATRCFSLGDEKSCINVLIYWALYND